MKYRLLFTIFIGFVTLNNTGCKKSPTEVDKPPITPTPPSLELSVDGVSCTEAWIKVKKLNDTTFLPISLRLNEKEFFRGYLAAADTIVFVDSLTPNATYTVKGIILDTLQTAKELKVTTLPTTSHNFTWQTFEFGDYNPSTLMDVTIIDENNIWAVGEIYMNDSLGQPDPNAYNAVHWDGSKWEVKRITTLFRGNYITVPLEGIFAFSSSDIWMVGSLPIYGDGKSWTMYDIRSTVDPNLSVSKAWGSNSSNMYFVGRGGNIAHNDGKSWTKIESGTNLYLTDIYGTAGGEIYAAGSDILAIKGVVVKRDKSGQWGLIAEAANISKEELFHPKLFGRLSTVWVDENNTVYTAGDYLYHYKNGNWDFVNSLPENKWNGNQYVIGYIYNMRGNKSNDIFLCGDFNTIRHFNGQSWEQLGIPFTPTRHIFWRNMAVKGNIVVAVGDEGSKAKIMVLKRQ